MLYLSYPWISVFKLKLFKKPISVHMDAFVVAHGINCDFWENKASMIRVAKYYYQRQLKDSIFINNLQRFWLKEVVPAFLKSNRAIFEKNLSNLSNDEFVNLINHFATSYINLFQEVIFLDSFDFYGDKILQAALEKENVKFLPKETELLTCPPKASKLQQERLSLLSLAEFILKNKVITKNIKKAKFLNQIKSARVKKKLNLISEQYCWLHNDYASIEYLKPEFFYRKLRDLILHKSKLNEEKAMRRSLKSISTEKKKIISKYSLSKALVNDLIFISSLGNLRDLRKSYNQLAGNAIQIIGQEVARRSGLDLAEVENLFFYELKSALKPSKALRKKIIERSRRVIYWPTAVTKVYEFYGRDAEILDKYIKDQVFRNINLKGRPAYRGIVRGVARIIKDKGDFKKMKLGDILVAPNTRPEYVPIMKIAGAIVTDEGGITSHAAIVSREFKVPCVVGVQGITSILKDGDLVEVDATKGEVRVIK